MCKIFSRVFVMIADVLAKTVRQYGRDEPAANKCAEGEEGDEVGSSAHGLSVTGKDDRCHE